MRNDYFQHLNYTLGDEDSRLELGILPAHSDHVMAVAGSGGRVLPLLARRPRRLTCVDICRPQLFLTELRVEALRALTRGEFLGLLGYPGRALAPEERRRLFRQLALSPDAARFFEGLFAAHGWGPLLYSGRFERTLRTLARVNGLLTGSRGRGLFETGDREAQRVYLERRFPRRAWRAVLLLLGNSAVLNSLLYKGDFPKKNIPGSAYRFYRDAFERLFSDARARESFFLQLVFFGELRFAEGLPVECDADVFEAARRALGSTAVSYVHGDILEVAQRAGDVDFLSLSDVPSFLPEEREQDFLQLLRPGLAPGGLVVTRGHLRVARPDASGFACISERYADLMSAEKTQMWSVNVYQKPGERRAIEGT